MKKIFATFCAVCFYLPINLWFPGRDKYYSFIELYSAFKQLYSEAVGDKN